MKDSCFSAADILLPDFSVTDGTKWAVIACDQYTSEPHYWESVKEKVGDAPSTLSLILPELYLNDERDARVDKINACMREYMQSVLKKHENSIIYLRRTCRDGTVRCGLVGKLDLDAYSFRTEDAARVRATEGTVLSRIPPRAAVRRDAEIELPHVMVLIDDAEGALIEPLADKTAQLPLAYAFDLMEGGGRVEGYFLPTTEIDALTKGLAAMEDRIGAKRFFYAVGDGNHSLASAKAHYEALKETLTPEEAAKHPARYALVELVNIHDQALVFEPIYRVAFHGGRQMVTALEAYAATCITGENDTQTVHYITAGREGDITFPHGSHSLTVGTLQIFLDDYCKNHPEVEVDYIHGEDSLRALSETEGAVGFLFDGMRKDELFSSVAKDGPLPRKTFSMGEAYDKRYYIEARAIK